MERGSAEHELIRPVGGAILGQGVEIEDLAEPQAHVDDEDDVQGLGYVGRLVGPNLETPGVAGDSGDVPFGHPGDAVEAQTRCISTGIVAPCAFGPGRGHGTGADEDEVAGANTQPCVLLRSLQVSRSDGVARLEPIDSEGTG